MLEKLKSRKFWVAVVSILVGVLGVCGANDSVIQMVSSVGLILVPAVIYIITEGKIDAASISSAANMVDMDALIAAVKEYFAAGNNTDTASAEEVNRISNTETEAAASV